MPISPSQFRRCYNRFQEIHTNECGWPLDSFSNRESFIFEQEGYKNAIPERAMAVMRPNSWSQKLISSGQILSAVIEAIELNGNNLLHWEGRHGPDSKVHASLLNGKDDPETRSYLETQLFQLYHNGQANKTTFEALVARCGRKYELLGYLFFVASPDRFLPLRTRTFDKAFQELGVDIKTEGNCGWENYLSFLSTIREVQRCLQAEGMTDSTLLDAHSFCWVLARHPIAVPDAPLKPTTSIRPFTGRLEMAHQGQFTPKDDADVRDMREEAQKRQASGTIAEEIALNAEKERLSNEGRLDLAAQVESVADRPGLGYDIRSFDSDGSERFIEVKNVSNGRQFFLSRGEWLTSRSRSNYWFYLVSEADSNCPCISALQASDLDEEHLNPIQYLVRFSR